MEIKQKIQKLIHLLVEKINEQNWFQKLRSKWEELDSQSKSYLKFASFGMAVIFTFIFTFSSLWKVYQLKQELSKKKELLNFIQSANDELRSLKDNINSYSSGIINQSSEPWPVYFESIAGRFGIGKENLSVETEVTGKTGVQYKETLFSLKIHHVNIRQVTEYSHALQTGQRPIKLRNLLIKTKEDLSGYMNAMLSISAFTPIESNP